MTNQAGMTLLEVMISMLILAFGILGLAPLIAVSIYGNTYSDDVGKANVIAQQEIESLSNIDTYPNLPYTATTDSVNGKFSVLSTVEDNTTNGSIPAGLYRIKVGITWVDNQSMPRRVDCTTYKPQP